MRFLNAPSGVILMKSDGLVSPIRAMDAGIHYYEDLQKATGHCADRSELQTHKHCDSWKQHR
jgi:hypothetical protein